MTTIENAIGGSRKTSRSSRTQGVFNPATGEQTATLPLSTTEEVGEAIAMGEARTCVRAPKSLSILNAAGEPLTLADVGFEVEGKHFWVYQETAEPPVLEGVKIRHDALRDLWPKQVNTLNVEGKGDIKTLTFADSVNLLEVSFSSQISDHH